MMKFILIVFLFFPVLILGGNISDRSNLAYNQKFKDRFMLFRVNYSLLYSRAGFAPGFEISMGLYRLGSSPFFLGLTMGGATQKTKNNYGFSVTKPELQFSQFGGQLSYILDFNSKSNSSILLHLEYTTSDISLCDRAVQSASYIGVIDKTVVSNYTRNINSGITFTFIGINVNMTYRYCYGKFRFETPAYFRGFEISFGLGSLFTLPAKHK